MHNAIQRRRSTSQRKTFMCAKSLRSFRLTSFFLPGLLLQLDKLVVYPRHVRGLEEGFQRFFSRGPVGVAREASVLVRACNFFNYHTTFDDRILLEWAEGRGGAEVALCRAWMGQQMGLLRHSRGSVLLVNHSAAAASSIARAFDITNRPTSDNDWLYRLCDFRVHKWGVRHDCMSKQPVF